MELHTTHVFSLQQPAIPKTRVIISPVFQIARPRNPTVRRLVACFQSQSKVQTKSTTLEQPGGKMVVELVGVFNELTERMNLVSTSSSRLLFKSLKLSIPILQSLPLTPDGRSPLTKALSVAMVLADLQVFLLYLFGRSSLHVVNGNYVTDS